MLQQNLAFKGQRCKPGEDFSTFFCSACWRFAVNYHSLSGFENERLFFLDHHYF